MRAPAKEYLSDQKVTARRVVSAVETGAGKCWSGTGRGISQPTVSVVSNIPKKGEMNRAPGWVRTRSYKTERREGGGRRGNHFQRGGESWHVRP
jgi:hypothetical protein